MGSALRTSSSLSPYEALLGPAFESLHPHVRRAHQPPLSAQGTMDVEHGHGWLARPMIRLMKLPAAGTGLPVALDIVERGPELVWRRRIGKSLLQTRQRARHSRLVERSGVGRIAFDLAEHGGALLYRQSSMHVAGVRLPSSLSPRVEALVSPRAEGWHVEVTVTWRGRLLCRYAGAICAS